MSHRSDSAGGGLYPEEWSRPTAFRNRWVKLGVYLSVLAFFVYSIWEIRVTPDRLLVGIEGARTLLSSMFPPDFGLSFEGGGIAVERNAELIRTGVVESLGMSVVATVVGVLVSVPIAFMAAENMVPRPVYYVGRVVVSVSRAFHVLVVAIIAVVAVGFGPLAGTLAMVFSTPGFFAKLLAEDLEDIDRTELDAIRSTGASRTQVILYGVVPQVLPRVIGLTIYRWDINIRAATIIGIVGAGGIGSTLYSSFQRYEYDFSLAIVLVIVAIVMIGEGVSAYARRRVQ